MTYSKIERQDHILKELQVEKKIVVAKIADALDVAPETIRRDFAELEDRHLLTRVHGGAVNYIQLRTEPEFMRKLDMQREVKRQIAKAAAKRICDGDTIAVDVGTTTVHLADFIDEVNNLTVVTNSIAAAERFNLAVEEKRMTGKIILLGGMTNPAQSSVVGAMTLEWLNNMNMDKAFLSCGGMDEQYVYDYDLDESLVSASMAQKSNSRILLTDATKIEQRSFYTVCEVNDFSEVICNQAYPEEWQDFKGKWSIVKGGNGQ